MFSIWFSLAALGLAIAFVVRAYELSPGLLVGLGAGAILASTANFLFLMDAIHQGRAYMATHGLPVSVSAGVGPWVQLVGAAVILVGGLMARGVPTEEEAFGSTHTPVSSMAPPRPDARSPRAQVALGTPTFLVSKRLLTVVAVLGAIVLLIGLIPELFSGQGLPYPQQAAVETPPPMVTQPPPPTIAPPTAASTPGPEGPAASPPPPAVPGGPDAVTYQVDVAHDGNARNANVRLPLRRAWVRSWSGQVSYPVVAGGRVFVSINPGDGSHQTLYALDATTGRTLWSHPERDSYFLEIAYDGGRVFALGEGGLVTAYAAGTGALDWSAQMPRQYLFTSPPAAWGGQLYVGGAGDGGTLYAVDETTGAVRWMQGLDYSDHSSPTLWGSRVAVGYDCPAFRVSDGARVWDYTIGCVNGDGRTIAYYGGRLYARDAGGPDGEIFDAATGRDLGSFPSSIIPAFSGDTGYFLENGTLRARDLGSMKALWSFAGDGTFVSAPLVVGGDVFEASASGRLYEIHPDGRVVGTFSLGAPVIRPDEQNAWSITGMNAGDGVLAVGASGRLVVFR